MKGQMSTELIALVAVLMFVLTLFSIISFSNSNQIIRNSEVASGGQLCSQFASEFNSAVIAGPGYVRSFSLPASLSSGGDYTLRLYGSGQMVEVWRSTILCSTPLLSSNSSFQGNSCNPFCSIPAGKVTITNVQGSIQLS